MSGEPDEVPEPATGSLSREAWENLYRIAGLTPTTKTGKVLTDTDLDALADEAERGYEVEHLLDAPARRRLPEVAPEHAERFDVLMQRIDAALVRHHQELRDLHHTHVTLDANARAFIARVVIDELHAELGIPAHR